jgi:GT2 family glycosyltransferase
MQRTKLTPEEMVRYLKDPFLLLQEQQTELPSAQQHQVPTRGLTLTKLLREIELAVKEDSLSLAQQLVNIIESWDLEIPDDERAWFLYHKGCLLLASGDTLAAKDLLQASLQHLEISWCHYKLAELYDEYQGDSESFAVGDALQAAQHFRRALRTKPTLSQEAEARATNWLSGFFDAKIYVRMNPELNQLNPAQLLGHFEKFGLGEGRIAGQQAIEQEFKRMTARMPNNFDWKEYLDCNPDLQSLVSDKNLTIAEVQMILSRHFLDHGREENRSYHYSEKNADHVNEQFYIDHKVHNNRLLDKKLYNFLKSDTSLLIGEPKKACITIIIVLHNKAAFTLECLKSVAASARKDIHLIIVDNNSTDQTSSVIARLEGNVSLIVNQKNSHFLLACNQALEQVETEYTCFLNNDAMLCEDTISEAVSCLSRYNNAAIIGGKVLHADGYIQDAGSIVFSDASCCGFGRRRCPGHHLYNFERTVDYVSGAFFTSTTELIRQLGCFDIRYAPAYYEDTDLCFRAASQGIPIVYCPTINIYHYEYASSGNTQWATMQMKKNQTLFHELHSERLDKHLGAGTFSRDNIEHVLHGHLRDGPRVLIIDDQIPEHQSGSGFSRSKDMLNHLSSHCGFITLYATDYERSRSNALSLPIRAECIENDTTYLRQIIQERASFYDYIIVSRKHNQELFVTIAGEIKDLGIILKSKVIFDAESLFSIRDYTFKVLEDTGKHVHSLAGLDLPSLTREEVGRFKLADMVTCVSELELNIISKHFPVKRCQLVGHCFPGFTDNEDFSFEQRDSIVFLGAVYEELSPNHDSLEWLFKDLLPGLETPLPGLKQLIIAGNIKCQTTRDLIKTMQERYSLVSHFGLVDDLELLFQGARLFLAPTRYAAGIPHKVHLASSYGVPTITTSLIAEQIGWKNKQALLLADTPREFADAVRLAFSDPESLRQVRSNMIRAFNNDCNPQSFDRSIQAIISVN